MRAIKEMSGTPTSRSDVQQGRTRDQPSGREPQGDGVPIVVVGVATHQGGRESRPQGEGAQVTGHPKNREVCVMQNAETVLDVLRERGRRGLPLDELYRQLFNPQLYLLAYGRIYSNKGAMTPGPDAETADGMTLGKIERIIDALRHERYRFKPVRRHYIPKKDGKQRPLGLPSWSDKLRRRSRASAVGGVLRAAVLRSLPRLPARPGLPHRACARWRSPGPGRPGLSRATSPAASTELDHQVMLDDAG